MEVTFIVYEPFFGNDQEIHWVQTEKKVQIVSKIVTGKQFRYKVMFSGNDFSYMTIEEIRYHAQDSIVELGDIPFEK